MQSKSLALLVLPRVWHGSRSITQRTRSLQRIGVYIKYKRLVSCRTNPLPAQLKYLKSFDFGHYYESDFKSTGPILVFRLVIILILVRSAGSGCK